MRVFALMLVAAAAVWGTPATARCQDSADSADVIGIIRDSAAWYQAHVEHLSPFQDSLVFRVYFRGSADTALVRVGTDSTGPVHEDVGIATPLPPTRPRDSADIVLLRCIGDDCRPARRQVTYDDFNLRVVVREPVSGKESFRLTAPAGAARLVSPEGAPGDTAASQAIDQRMPRMFDEENTLLGGAPLIKFDLAPLVRAIETGEGEGAALSFEGGYHRYGRRSRFGISYDGDLGTDTLVSFDALRANGEWEMNLRRSSFNPLLLTFGGESDGSFDVTNLVGGVSVRGVLPIFLNFSPRGAGYIPNVGPQWRVGLEGGFNVRDEDDTQSASFTRPHYKVRWMIPLAANTVARLDHSGLWTYEAGFQGRPEYHPTWDTGVELRMGGTTYFAGYRRGEAAPNFREIKAFSIGVVIGVREP